MNSIYLFTGPEAGEKNDAVNSIKNALSEKFENLDTHLFYAGETPAAQYISILQTESLFAGACFVVVKNAHVIGKAESKLIAEWAASKTAISATLILISDENSVDTEIEKCVPTKNKKIFWEMFENRKAPWVNSFFFKNGYAIEEDAVNLILEMVENNTQALKTECSRFFILFEKSHKITADDVESVLSNSREESPFSLFNALCETSLSVSLRLEKSIEILQKIRLSGEGSCIAIIAALSSCFRKLNLYHKLCRDGKCDDFNLKINGISGAKMKAQYLRASQIWSRSQTFDILSLLAKTDADIRISGSLMEDEYMQKLIYEIIVKQGVEISA